MKQVFLYRKGIEIKEVPEPIVEKGKILIKNLYSCVSPGTEISSLNSIKKNILKKIFEKPQVLKSLIDVLKKRGIKNTRGIVSRKLAEFYELGYSSSGIIEAPHLNTYCINVGTRQKKRIKANKFVSNVSYSEKEIV